MTDKNQPETITIDNTAVFSNSIPYGPLYCNNSTATATNTMMGAIIVCKPFYDELDKKFTTPEIVSSVNSIGITWKNPTGTCTVSVNNSVKESPDPHAIFFVQYLVHGDKSLEKHMYFNSMDAVCEHFQQNPPVEILSKLEQFYNKITLFNQQIKTEFDIELL